MPRLLENSGTVADAHFAVVATQFHADIVDALLEGSLAGLAAAGVPRGAVRVERVPGAFELPVACQEIAATRRYAAVIALGCVIRGETTHFDYVAGECCRGLMDAGLRTGIPVILGVLTTDDLAQARRRASRGALRGSAPDAAESAGAAGKTAPESNKGWECAQTALAMAALLGRVRAEENA